MKIAKATDQHFVTLLISFLSQSEMRGLILMSCFALSAELESGYASLAKRREAGGKQG